MAEPHGREHPPIVKERASSARARSREAPYIFQGESAAFALLLGADDAEFRFRDDDSRGFRPRHLLSAGGEVDVEAADAVPPSSGGKREHDGGPQRHRPERSLV